MNITIYKNTALSTHSLKNILPSMVTFRHMHLSYFFGFSSKKNHGFGPKIYGFHENIYGFQKKNYGFQQNFCGFRAKVCGFYQKNLLFSGNIDGFLMKKLMVLLQKNLGFYPLKFMVLPNFSSAPTE